MITSKSIVIFSPVEVISNEYRSSWINVPEFSTVFEMERRTQVKEEGKKVEKDEVDHEEEVKKISPQTEASPDTKDFTDMQPEIGTISSVICGK